MDRRALYNSSGRFLVALLGILYGSTPLKAGTIPVGIGTAISARDWEFYCSGCGNNTNTQLWFNRKGDDLVNRKPKDEDAAALTGRASTSAVGQLVGPNQLPRLSAVASTGIIAGLDPPVYLYSAFAEADGYQTYSFSSATLGNYTIAFTVDGEITGGSKDVLNLNRVYASLTAYEGVYDVFGEVNPIRDSCSKVATGTGSPTPVHIICEINIGQLQPGDRFTVSASLHVSSSTFDGSFPGSADASHTMNVFFTSGDTSLLIPANAAAVPEPGSVLLLCTGLLWIGTIKRKLL